MVSVYGPPALKDGSVISHMPFLSAYGRSFYRSNIYVYGITCFRSTPDLNGFIPLQNHMIIEYGRKMQL